MAINAISLKEFICSYKKDKYAYCSGCEQIFIDDIDIIGNVICPECHFAIERGIVLEKLKGLCGDK